MAVSRLNENDVKYCAHYVLCIDVSLKIVLSSWSLHEFDSETKCSNKMKFFLHAVLLSDHILLAIVYFSLSKGTFSNKKRLDQPALNLKIGSRNTRSSFTYSIWSPQTILTWIPWRICGMYLRKNLEDISIFTLNGPLDKRLMLL